MVTIYSISTFLASGLSIPQNSGSAAVFVDPTGFTSVGHILTDLIPYVFVISGILLFFFLASGGFDLMTAAGDPKKTDQAKEKITNSLVGFIIIFTAYWIYQIVNYVLGIQ